MKLKSSSVRDVVSLGRLTLTLLKTQMLTTPNWLICQKVFYIYNYACKEMIFEEYVLFKIIIILTNLQNEQKLD